VQRVGRTNGAVDDRGAVARRGVVALEEPRVIARPRLCVHIPSGSHGCHESIRIGEGTMERRPTTRRGSHQMIHADRTLAERLEEIICGEFRHLAAVARRTFPDSDAECIDVAGGVALWLGDGSPMNCAAGVGMEELPSEMELDRLERFYHERGAPAVADVCTLADPGFILALGRRGWTASEFENVLALDLRGDPLPDRLSGEIGTGMALGPAAGNGGTDRAPQLEVRVCASTERALWAQLATAGFADGDPPGRGPQEFGRIMAARDEAVLFVALVDGQPAGTGALVMQGGVGWLSADSTLPPYRRLGVQQAVQRARLRLARDAGCSLAVTEAVPGGTSQRNMERLGFRIVYLHVEFVRPAGAGPFCAARDR